jgi:hypothetical protein
MVVDPARKDTFFRLQADAVPRTPNWLCLSFSLLYRICLSMCRPDLVSHTWPSRRETMPDCLIYRYWDLEARAVVPCVPIANPLDLLSAIVILVSASPSANAVNFVWRALSLPKRSPFLAIKASHEPTMHHDAFPSLVSSLCDVWETRESVVGRSISSLFFFSTLLSYDLTRR